MFRKKQTRGHTNEIKRDKATKKKKKKKKKRKKKKLPQREYYSYWLLLHD